MIYGHDRSDPMKYPDTELVGSDSGRGAAFDVPEPESAVSTGHCFQGDNRRVARVPDMQPHRRAGARAQLSQVISIGVDLEKSGVSVESHAGVRPSVGRLDHHRSAEMSLAGAEGSHLGAAGVKKEDPAAAATFGHTKKNHPCGLALHLKRGVDRIA